MTYTTFKLVNSTFRISIGADPNTKFCYCRHSAADNRCPPSSKLCNLATVSMKMIIYGKMDVGIGNLGTNCEDDLGFGDVADTKVDTIATEIICQKDQKRYDTNYKCDIWEPRQEKSQQLKLKNSINL